MHRKKNKKHPKASEVNFWFLHWLMEVDDADRFPAIRTRLVLPPVTAQSGRDPQPISS